MYLTSLAHISCLISELYRMIDDFEDQDDISLKSDDEEIPVYDTYPTTENLECRLAKHKL
jgi:hypothetical protein